MALLRFKALSDETRLRLVHILLHYELSVNELVRILGMGQSRVSRHLKILTEAGLLQFRRDGLWVFYATPRSGEAQGFLRAVMPFVQVDALMRADLVMAAQILEERAQKTRQFFNAIAEDWDELNREVLENFDLPQAVCAAVPKGCGIAVDLGCGTGAVLACLLPLTALAQTPIEDLGAQLTQAQQAFTQSTEDLAAADKAVAELEKKYTSDASVIPAGMVINEDYANGTNIITLNDAESLLYFAYVLDANEAYLNSEDYTAGHGYTSIWYPKASTRHVVLNSDVDLEGMVMPEGMNNFAYFDFDGQNHTISNAKIAYEGTERAALFAGSNRGVFNLTVKNIHVTAPNIETGCAGILCSDPNAPIDNVTVLNSSVKGGKYTGGVVGYNYGSITNCTGQNSSVSGRYKTGGIVGYLCNSNNVNQLVTGNILDTVNVVVEDLLSGKHEVVGQVVGNWNSSKGECRNNTITNVTGATTKIGEIEAGALAGLVQD